MLKLLLLTLLLIPTSLFADSILYTFTTITGGAGSFTFEESTPLTISTGIIGTHHFPESQFPTPWMFAQSELSPISGSFGDYSFSGTASIWRNDYMFPFDSALDLGQQDFWILHSSLSSTMVLGRSLTALNLFDYLSPRADMGALLDPPPNPRCDTGGGTHSPNCSDFQYYAQFSDGTFESGGLLSLTLVPEMPSLALLPLGLIGILLVYRPERAEA